MGYRQDADLVFDVRFLPNPYYVDELRPQTGMDDGSVQLCDGQNQTAKDFADKLEDMMTFSDSELRKGREDKPCDQQSDVRAVKHRSVTLARVLYDRLHAERSYGIRLEHRDIGKDALRKNK